MNITTIRFNTSKIKTFVSLIFSRKPRKKHSISWPTIIARLQLPGRVQGRPHDQRCCKAPVPGNCRTSRKAYRGGRLQARRQVSDRATDFGRTRYQPVPGARSFGWPGGRLVLHPVTSDRTGPQTELMLLLMLASR